MTRNPFAWEIQVRREVLDDEMERLRELPYSLWRQVMKAPISKVVTARDDKPYLLKVSAAFVAKDSEDIRVTLSLGRRALLRKGTLRQEFIITPDNNFRT